MRAITAVLAFLLIAVAAAAQEGPRPDYSRESLMRLLADNPTGESTESNVHFYFGAVDFGALGTRWRFNYLPLLMPLSGTRLGTSQEWPDAFALTGTAIATPPRSWRTHRERNAELRRIEKSERAKIKAKISVKAKKQ